MKKIILSFLVSLLSLTSWTQNGGQANANDLIRIDYAGYSAGDHVFKITNLGSCIITAQYTIWGSATIQSIGIFAYESVYIRVTAPQSTTVYARAKTTTYCNGPVPDRGWVEAMSFGGVLPTGLLNCKVKRINAKQAELTFMSSKDMLIDHYNIKVSRDGRIFKTVRVLFPNGVQGTKTYNIVIDL